MPDVLSPDVLSPDAPSDPSLYNPLGPQGPAGPPPGGYVPPGPSSPGPYVPPLEAVAVALACASGYLDRPAHDATFRSALGELEAPALAAVQLACAREMTPPQVADAIAVCDFYGDFDGPLADDFTDLLDEHAYEMAGSILRLAVGG